MLRSRPHKAPRPVLLACDLDARSGLSRMSFDAHAGRMYVQFSDGRIQTGEVGYPRFVRLVGQWAAPPGEDSEDGYAAVEAQLFVGLFTPTPEQFQMLGCALYVPIEAGPLQKDVRALKRWLKQVSAFRSSPALEAWSARALFG